MQSLKRSCEASVVERFTGNMAGADASMARQARLRGKLQRLKAATDKRAQCGMIPQAQAPFSKLSLSAS
ncbi:hypothetical protein CGZ75_11000 [Paenibacillus herberti]|uniref:Uncharacterized protein n=1 Tax=Paenibacillus herberti TaxID=1619309 RepID=A0A229P4Z0_9BACL|nr:hypothetical protein CGZ75_11000 [Paenibacillus herberti]